MKYLGILATILILVTGLTACSNTMPITTLTTTPTGMPQYRPIEVVGVVGPIPPYNPGGPMVEVTLKNIGGEPVVQLKAALQLGKYYDFSFNVTASAPLVTGQSTTFKRILVGPGSTIDSEASYPLKIAATLQSGSIIEYTVQVKMGRYC
jgi:hypothetical protein